MDNLEEKYCCLCVEDDGDLNCQPMKDGCCNPANKLLYKKREPVQSTEEIIKQENKE